MKFFNNLLLGDPFEKKKFFDDGKRRLKLRLNHYSDSHIFHALVVFFPMYPSNNQYGFIKFSCIQNDCLLRKSVWKRCHYSYSALCLSIVKDVHVGWISINYINPLPLCLFNRPKIVINCYKGNIREHKSPTHIGTNPAITT